MKVPTRLSQKEIAIRLGTKQQNVSRWLNHRVPAERVISIYRLTGITPHELRPDIYPNPTDGIPANKQNTL
ncbi:MAG: transcriptional regulator [Candidatus Arsenophonus phytopathogenicus]